MALMAPSGGNSRPYFDSQTLEQYRRATIDAFIAARAEEGGQRYREKLRESTIEVTQLFEATQDLQDLASGGALSEQPGLIEPARYLGGPPISADDLDTLSEAKIAGRRRIPLDLAQRATKVILSSLDRERFPWLFESPMRAPTVSERDMAIRWTAGLMAVQRMQTARRNEAAKR